MRANPRDARAPYYLGNLLYDRRRHEEAIRLWERSAKLDPAFPIVWRNLGIGYFNIRRQPAKARAAYEKAFRAEPARRALLFERDQLWKRLGEKPEKRLRELEQAPATWSRQRDDLSVELCALYNQTGRHGRGAGFARLAQVPALGRRRRRAARPARPRSHLALGREALARGDAAGARDHFAGGARGPAEPRRSQAPARQPERRPLLAGLGAGRRWATKPAARNHWLARRDLQGRFPGDELSAPSAK